MYTLLKRNLKKAYKGFTLVELVVIIGIIAVLGTIGFINLGGYQRSARDSTRIENLSKLYTGLNQFQTKSGSYPMPESPVTIKASGVDIGYQGFAGDLIGSIANLSKGGTLDPVDSSISTTYSINASQSKMQLMTFLEDGNNAIAFVPTAYASANSDYSKRSPMVKGDTLGILLGSGSLRPIQESGTGVDIALTSTSYTAVFGKGDSVVGTGSTLFTSFYNRNYDLINNKSFASLDPNLIGYWDMETLTGSLLKDLSKYGNNGVCYGSGSIEPCGAGNGGLVFVDGKGGNGKALKFNSIKNTQIVTSTGGISPSKPITVMVSAKFDGFANQNGLVFINNLTCNRYLFSSTWKTSGVYNGSHVGTCSSGGNWGTATSEDVSYFTDNTWYSIVYVVNPMDGYTKVFRDGQIIQNISYTAYSSFNGTPINIWIGGNNESAAYAMNGAIDEVRIYNRAFSDGEIAALYNSTK